MFIRLLNEMFLSLIYWLNINGLNLWWSFYDCDFWIFKQSKFKTCLQRVFLSWILSYIVSWSTAFCVLVLILEYFIADFFVSVYCISVNWYWYLSLGGIVNCMWAIYKSDIWIWLYCRIDKYCCECESWV